MTFEDRLTPADNPISKRMGNPVLKVQDLGKVYQVGSAFKSATLRALHEVSFELYRGECIALVGESGSGKSTILRILARLEQPSHGTITFLDEDILKKEPTRASLEYRSKIQMIFQDPFGSLNPIHTVYHHLKRPLLRHGRVADHAHLEKQVHSLLETVGLNPAADFARKYPYQMSGGQRQRVAIARALAVEPTVILADEPISMLDVSIRMGILNLMHELKTGTSAGLLYVTHDIASARYIADRTMVMYAGHLVEGGPSEVLLDDPAHPYTKLLLAAVPDPHGSIFRELPARSGQPQLIGHSTGCPFAERCPETMDICRTENPPPIPLRRKSAHRFVRCHLYK